MRRLSIVGVMMALVGCETVEPNSPPRLIVDPVMAAAVFFEAGSSTIGLNGDRTVRDVTSAAQPDLAVQITAHADKVDTPHANPVLSCRRAKAVRQALVEREIDAGRIFVEARGDTQLFILTGRQVAEPQNRRAELEVVGGDEPRISDWCVTGGVPPAAPKPAAP